MMAVEDDVVARVEQDCEMMLRGVGDEVEDDRGLLLEPLQLRDGICEVRAREDFRRMYAIAQLHASGPWKTT
jgi:hypothetical protein